MSEISELKKLNTIKVYLDQIKNWEFEYKGKIYKLNVKEVLRLLELVKGERLEVKDEEAENPFIIEK